MARKSRSVLQIALEVQGDRQVQSKVKGVEKTFSGLETSIKGLGAGLLAGVSIAEISRFTSESVSLAREQAAAEAQVAAAIASTGNAAGTSLSELKAHASQLQNMTNFGDEATLQAQALLLTFKQIGGDTFPRATAAILDTSTAMNQGLKETSIQVGKALNDPVQGLSALRRVGIQFTDDQEELIQAFVEANDVASAQSIILSELESQFGGSAAAVRKADGGFQALQNTIGDTQEAFGKLFLTLSDQSGGVGSVDIAFQVITDRLTDLNTRLEAGIPLAREYFASFTGIELPEDFTNQLRDVADVLQSGSAGILGNTAGFAIDFGLDIATKQQEQLASEAENTAGNEQDVTDEIKEQNAELERQLGIIGVINTFDRAGSFAKSLADPDSFKTIGQRVQDARQQSERAAQEANRASEQNARDRIRDAQRIANETVRQQEAAARESAAAYEREFSRIEGVVSGVIGQAAGTLGGLGLDFLDEDVGREVGEDARRLAAIAVGDFNGEAAGLLAQSNPELFKKVMESENPAAVAQQMLRDFQLGIGAAEIIGDTGRENAKRRIRRILLGTAETDALVREITQELLAEGQFTQQQISAAIGQSGIAGGGTDQTSAGGQAAALSVVDGFNNALPQAIEDAGTGSIMINLITTQMRNQEKAFEQLGETFWGGFGKILGGTVGELPSDIVKVLATAIKGHLGVGSAGAAANPAAGRLG